jgi:hypothetical protein
MSIHVGVGFLLGKYDVAAAEKVGKIYILKLTPNSPAMVLHEKSKTENGKVDIAENDIVTKVRRCFV